MTKIPLHIVPFDIHAKAMGKKHDDMLKWISWPHNLDPQYVLEVKHYGFNLSDLFPQMKQIADWMTCNQMTHWPMYGRHRIYLMEQDVVQLKLTWL
jgi:hypothetical protein